MVGSDEADAGSPQAEKEDWAADMETDVEAVAAAVVATPAVIADTEAVEGEGRRHMERCT